MPNRCSCGGALKPYMEDKVHFAWKCEGCNKVVRQRKRRSLDDDEIAEGDPLKDFITPGPRESSMTSIVIKSSVPLNQAGMRAWSWYLVDPSVLERSGTFNSLDEVVADLRRWHPEIV